MWSGVVRSGRREGSEEELSESVSEDVEDCSFVDLGRCLSQKKVIHKGGARNLTLGK